jgi:hypothetical protein
MFIVWEKSKLFFFVFQFGNEESGVDSSTEIKPKETDGAVPTEPRKHKKKKKKHKHKDEKGKRKMSTSSSNYDSPLMFDANAVSSI